MNSKEIFEKYHETFYEDQHEWRDYELTSAGYGEWYYDCLPTDKKARILDIGCGDGKFLSFVQQQGYQSIEEWNFHPSRQMRPGSMQNALFMWLMIRLPFFINTLTPIK